MIAVNHLAWWKAHLGWIRIGSGILRDTCKELNLEFRGKLKISDILKVRGTAANKSFCVYPLSFPGASCISVSLLQQAQQELILAVGEFNPILWELTCWRVLLSLGVSGCLGL